MPTGVYTRSEKTRIKMSLSAMGNKRCLGRKLSKKTKKKIARSLQGNKLSESTKDKIRLAHLGSNSYIWKGEKAGYSAKHIWMSKTFGKPKFCEHCKSKNAKRYEWANISKKYRRKRNDWLRLCKSCHIKYDRKKRIRPYPIKSPGFEIRKSGE